MPFRGDLRDFSALRLLEIMAEGRKTGTLTIEALLGGEARRPSRFHLFFREGALLHIAQEEPGGPALLQFMREQGKITSPQEKTLLSQTHSQSEKETAVLLMNAGLASRQEILQSVEARFWRYLETLFMLQEGGFHFQPNTTPPPDRITLQIPMARITLQGQRYLRERAAARVDSPPPLAV